jgi:peptide/nickel transport system permease protein
LDLTEGFADLLKYIATRLLIAIPTIFGVTVIIFLIMRALPGDPLSVFYDPSQIIIMSDSERASIMAELGLDKPLVVQYSLWAGNALKGDLGTSFLRGDAISETIIRRGAISAEIGILSILIAWLLGLPVGILSAMRPNSIADGVASLMSVLFLAIPGFWLGLLIVLGLIHGWSWHPPIISSQIWDDPWKNFQIVIGPALVLGLGQAAIVARMARSSLFEVFREDYVRTARAKGMRESVVLLRHALPNALLPVITLSGVLLGFALGGSVTVERAFGTPGLGTTLIAGAIDRDTSMVQSIVLVYSMVFIGMNLLVDLSYSWIDPRVRLG